MAATTAPLMTTAGVPAASFSDFNWQNEDFSWLTTGQGFGTGNPAELYLNGWDFSWLPDNLPPKAQPGVDIPVTDHPIPTGVDTSKGWVESFDSGPGLFGRYWGGGVDFSTPGQVTIHRTADEGDSGMMVPPTGASAGSGYGLFSWTLSMTGKIGVYALAWPGTDVWPGPELDMIELTPEGKPYSTIHWKGADGGNEFAAYGLDGVDPTQVHTYSMLWQPGRLTGYVDGHQLWTTTEHVPSDFAHGGENEAMGIGVQTSWNAQYQHGENAITIYDASWSPIG